MIQSTLSNPTRKEVLQSFRTRSLLEATRKVIAAEGFDAVTMERVSAEAGLTKGAIYLYFRNKDHLIVAAVEEMASEMLRQIEARIDFKATPWDRVCQTIRAQLEIMEEQKDLLRVLLLDRRLLRDSPKGSQGRRLLKYRERHEARLKKFLDQGIKQKIFRPMDTGLAAFYINEMTISTAGRRMMDRSMQSLDRDTQDLIAFVGLLRRKGARQNGVVR
ncbi:MAG TPA: helix-turn-helix domain-containing protein [Candidatus Binatia bacterium]|jgi:AcrR family transcriptional regulator